jgi:hypothetical protein
MYGKQPHFNPMIYDYTNQQQQFSHVKNINNEPSYNSNYSSLSFSSSPETYSTGIDLQSSCESLSAAFSQASLNTTMQYGPNYLDPLDEYFNEQDEDLQEYETPSAETILFYEILQDFPDLSTFVCHKDFGVFAHLWLDLQQKTRLAKEPSERPAVQSWLKGAALHIHFLLVTIVKTNPGNNDLKSEPRCMFSAFRRLKDRIEIMHQVFELIENGRVWFNQTPSQAIAPLLKTASEILKDIKCFEKNPEVIPLVDPSNDRVELVNAKQVTMKDLSNRVLDSYNIMPYSSDSTAVNNLIVQPKQQDGDGRSCLDLSSWQQDSCSSIKDPSVSGFSTPAAFYIQQQCLALGNTTGESNPTINQSHTAPPFSHIQPAWIHPSDTWSMLVTPCIPTNTTTTSPTCTQDQYTIAGTVYTPCNTVRDLSLSPNPATPLNTLSEENSEYEDSTYSIQNDEDYTVSDADDDEDWKESSPPRRRSKQAIAATVAAATMANKASLEQDPLALRKRKPQQANQIRRRVTEKRYTRRTATSYDSKTTHYLKSVFFDIYSSKDKLTKEQRRQVQKDTGLKPRNITYWFSNHKRRFQASLAVYKKVVKESQGKVRSYDDFLNWRRFQGLPDEVMDAEAVGLDLIDAGKHTLVLSRQQQQ